MSWRVLKNNIWLYLAFIVLIVALILVSQSSSDDDTKETVQDSEKAIITLREKAQKTEAEIKTEGIELKRDLAAVAEKNKIIATREKEILRLKTQLKAIPKRNEPFKKLEACQADYTALWIEYTGRGKLIVSLESQVLDYGQLKLDYRSALKNYGEIARLNEELKEGHAAEIVEKNRIINAYKKKRAPLVAIVIGGGIGINGRPFFGIAGGINITGFFKRLF